MPLRMLRALDIQAAPVAKPLLNAASLIRDGRSHDGPRAFLRPASKWHRYLDAQPKGDKRLWEVAVLSHLRDGFRSGDLWLPRSRRHGDPTQALVPLPVTTSNADTGRAARRRRMACRPAGMDGHTDWRGSPRRLGPGPSRVASSVTAA